jgi:hypothetical protein
MSGRRESEHRVGVDYQATLAPGWRMSPASSSTSRSIMATPYSDSCMGNVVRSIPASRAACPEERRSFQTV